MTEISQTGKST